MSHDAHRRDSPSGKNSDVSAHFLGAHMSIFEPSPWAVRMLSVFRIVAALVFMSFGTMKLFNWPPSGMPGLPVSLMSEAGLAGVLEVFGGLAILLGAFTRPVAFVLSGEMAVAYFQAHFPKS